MKAMRRSRAKPVSDAMVDHLAQIPREKIRQMIEAFRQADPGGFVRLIAAVIGDGD